MSVSLRLACIVFVLACAAQTQAAGLRLDIARLDGAGLRLDDIQIELLPGAGGGQDLHLQVGALAWPAFDLTASDLRAHCPLQPDAGAWRCAGQAELRADAAAPLAAGFAASLREGRLELELNRAPARLRLTQGGADEAAWQLQLRQLPLQWLSRWLTTSWPAISRVEGQLALDASLPRAAAAASRIDYSLRDAGFDTTDGRSAAAHLNLAGKLEYRAGPPWRLIHHGQISGGELLQGGVHLAFADQGTRLDFTLAPESDGYRLDPFAYVDPGVLELEGAARITPAAAVPLSTLRLQRLQATLPQAQQRYLASLLATAGWPALETRGKAVGRFEWDTNGALAADLRLTDVDLADAGRGLAVRGLDGSLAWQRSGSAAATELNWQSAALYRLPLGPARLRWQSREGALELLPPARIPLLGGTLEWLQLRLQPAAASGERIQAGLAVHGIDLAALSGALGWPRFGGKLGGAVPQLRYADERLELSGGLLLNVFDGTLNVTGLALERPFGVAPALSADLAFSALDLALITGTFDIGDISGRLSGHVRGLRLVDWSPVAFDAQLEALQGGRISQRAVTTISSVGGGGLAAGLQASLLKLFDTFGYARLGIGCRLHNAVCHMRGLAQGDGRFVLVEGRGLPRIQIVGHQSEVDWAVLVERLKAAASGTKPVID